MDHVTGQRMIRMELKYCERCGGLLLRRAGEAVVYCSPCEAQMRELPEVRESQRQAAAVSGRGKGTSECVSGTHDDEAGGVSGRAKGPGRIPPQRATIEGVRTIQGRFA
jgi:uncharacterized Zn finger protein (UPF0148 family)